MRRLSLLLLLFCLPLVSLPSAMAQSTASIVGTVMDSSGAAMPNVKIVVACPAQGIERPTTSDSVGAYKVGSLPIGTYSVTAEAPGFQKLIQTGVTLDIGRIQRVDLTMKVGTTSQEITVTGNVVKVQTDDGVQSSIVSGTQVQALNLNGRVFVQLVALVPGVTPDNGTGSLALGKGVGGSYEFSGSRHDYEDWREDGGNIYNWQANGNFHTTPSLDAIGEFKISTSNYGADLGARSGAVIEVATKSGTQDFHGDAYEYVRNQMFDANPFFTNRQLWTGLEGSAASDAQYCGGRPTGPCNAPKVPLKYNDFGYTVGGPIYIPGHYNTDKSKTFFFWSHEFRREIAGTTLSSSAPTARMRAGDFSECDPTSANFNGAIGGCSASLPKDPLTGLYFTREGNGLVPQGAGQAQVFLSNWVPLPNNGPTGWQSSPGVPTLDQQQMIRVDQNVGDKTRIFARFTYEGYSQVRLPVFYTSSSFDTIYSVYGGPGYNWVVRGTHTFSPTIVNDVMIHYDYYHNDWHNYAGPDGGPNAVSKPANWSSLMKTLFPANANQPVLPGISVSDSTLSFAEDYGPRPYIANENNSELNDNLAITKGNHFLKMGFSFIHMGDNDWDVYTVISSSATAQGELTFSSSAGGAAQSTGSALADMMLGRIASYVEATANQGGVQTGGYPHANFTHYAIEPYFQDDWRVTHRLTLNIGVRAYYLTRDHDKLKPSLDTAFYPTLYNPAVEAPMNSAGIITPNPATGQIYNFTMFGNGLVQCGQGAIPQGCQIPDGVRPAPRFGFAYQPFKNANTVIRGGYGMYYDQLTSNEPGAEGVAGNVPNNLVSTASNVYGPAPNYGYGAIAPGGAGPAPFAMDTANQQYPRTQQFSFGFQHQFSGNNRMSLSYVGNVSQHLSRTRQFNMVQPGTTTLTVPALAGTTYCDANGVCNVQAALIGPSHKDSVNFFRPYQGYASIGLVETSAASNYHSLQAELRHEFGHDLTMEAAYTWSHMIDDGSNYGSDPGINDANMRRYYATSSLNRTQVVNLDYIYKLPFLKNASNHYLKNAFGGWEISGITAFFTGLPINFGCSESGYGTGIGMSAMCNSLSPVKINKSGVINVPLYGPLKQWYNPTDVGQIQLAQLSANNQPGMFGWMGLNQLTGPGRNNFDLALHKEFTAPWFKGEHSTVQFRWETFNTFNHTQYSSASTGCSSATPFGNACGQQTVNGSIINGSTGAVSAAWPNRIMQFGLKFLF